MQPGNVSYFTSAQADYNQPESVLAGDRNIIPGNPSATESENQSYHWNQTLHQGEGNLLYADGHVTASRSFALGTWVTPRPVASNRVPRQTTPASPLSPLSPQQATAISTLLAHGIVFYPLAAFRPVIIRRLSGISAANPLDSQTLPAPAEETLARPPSVPSPALVSQAPAPRAPTVSEEESEPMQFYAHPSPRSQVNYVAVGSWWLLVLAALQFAWQICRRSARLRKQL